MAPVAKRAIFAGSQLPAVRRPRSQNPALVYLARLAPGSRRVQLSALQQLAELLRPGRDIEDLPWGSLRYQHTQSIRAQIAERYTPATANRYLAALRGTLLEAWRLGQIDREAFERASDLAPIKGSRLPAGRRLTGEELCALIDACDVTTAAGARDAAIVSVLYGAGLRRFEAAQLELQDVLPTGTITVRRGKGNKARTVPMPKGAFVLLQGWIQVRGPAPGPLFCHVAGHSTTLLSLSGQGIRDVLSKLQRIARVAAFAPHDLRRTFISDLLDRGADIAKVQRMAGHSKVDTTARYDRRGDEALRDAAQLLELRRSR